MMVKNDEVEVLERESLRARWWRPEIILLRDVALDASQAQCLVWLIVLTSG